MQIEKVSKYVFANTPSRSSEGSTARKILISIPRLRWLENGNTDFYGSFSKMNDTPGPRIRSNTHDTEAWAQRLAGQPLTEREQKAYDLMKTGIRQIQAADIMGIPRSTFRDILIKIKAKKLVEKTGTES